MRTDDPDSDVVRFFCRHLVAISIAYRVKGDAPSDPLRAKVVCGTLLLLHGGVSWFTAGHILEGIKKDLANPDIEYVHVRLVDTLGPNTVSRFPIPFDFSGVELIHLVDDDLGLDMGVIPLRPYYVDLLARNGVVAIERENWIHQKAIDFRAFFILGMPDEFTGKRLTANGDLAMSPTMLPVEQIEKAPPRTKPSAYPRFIGKIHVRPDQIESVVGMSGGPIVGLAWKENADGNETEMRYWLVALQSAWRPDHRVIFGCPIPVLEDMIGGGKLIAPTHGKRRPAPPDIWDWQAIDTWRDTIWDLMADVITDEVKAQFIADKPDDLYNDDLSSLDRLIRRVTGKKVNSKARLARLLRKRYRAVRGVHGTRTADVPSFYKLGIVPLDASTIAEKVLAIFSPTFPDLTIDRVQYAMKDLNFDIDRGKVFVETNEQALIDDSAHYMIYGSEIVLGIATRLGYQYEKHLKTLGLPTLFICDVPFNLLWHSSVEQFAGTTLKTLFDELLGHDRDPHLGHGLGVRGRLPPSCIVGHYHPTGLRNPQGFGFSR